MIKRPELFRQGYHQDHFPKALELMPWVHEENWDKLDSEVRNLTSPDGELFTYLAQFAQFESIEFIISIRDAQNEWEEDGIWHDDGSRVFAFSLSLTPDARGIEGGKLGVRKKTQEEYQEIPTPEASHIILFLTGISGYEHKIHQVKKGRRIIIAGWCS